MASIVNITNVSAQVVSFNYNTIASAKSVTTVSSLSSGVMHLLPQTNVEIEEERVDTNQLSKLRQLKLITYVVR